MPKNAHSKGIDNIEFIQTSWPEADLSALGWIKRTLIQFCIFLSGIDSAEALEKIVKASHKHCFISGFVTQEDRIMDRLKRRFGIKVNSWGAKSTTVLIYCGIGGIIRKLPTKIDTGTELMI